MTLTRIQNISGIQKHSHVSKFSDSNLCALHLRLHPSINFTEVELRMHHLQTANKLIQFYYVNFELLNAYLRILYDFYVNQRLCFFSGLYVMLYVERQAWIYEWN